MPAVHDVSSKLQEVELILQYLSQPANLTSPDSEYIRAIVAQKALGIIQEVIDPK